MIQTDKPDFREDLSKSVEMLRNGGYISVRTDCGSIIACDASNATLVGALIEANKEGKYDQLLLFASLPRLQSVTDELPDIVWELTEVSDKPLIIVPDGYRNLPDVLNKNTGFRISNWPFSNYLCDRFRQPLFCLEENRHKFKATDFDFLHKDNLYQVKFNKDKNPLYIPSVMQIGKGGTFKILRNEK